MSVHVIQGGSLYILVVGKQEIPIQGSQALSCYKELPISIGDIRAKENFLQLHPLLPAFLIF